MSKRYHSLYKRITRLLILAIILCGGACMVFLYVYVDRTIVSIKKEEFTRLHVERTSQLTQEFRRSLAFAKLIAIRTRVVEYLEDPTMVRHDELVGIFDQYPKENPEYLSVFLLDATGSAQISTDRSLVGNNYSFRRYFQSAMAGTPFVDVLHGATTKELGYFFAAPVVGTKGKPIGVVVAKRNPTSVYSTIVATDIFKKGTVMLTDEYGVIIYSSDERRLFHSLGVLPDAARQHIVDEKRYTTATISALQYENLQNTITNKKQSGVMEFVDAEDKERELLSIQKVGEYPFYFIYELYLSELQLIAFKTVGILLGSVIVALIIGMVLLYFVMQKTLKPLSTLKRVAEQAAEGNINQEVVVHTGDELEAVADAFTLMFAKLRESTSSLDQKVKQQTAALEAKTKELEDKQRAMLNVLEDVDAEKTKSQRLARDLEKFKLAVEHASDHIVITDSDGVVLYANHAVEQITGFATSEIVGRKAGVKMLWGGLMEQPVYASFWKTIKEDKQTFVGEFKNHRKNGEEYIAEAHVAPILDEQGKVVFFVGIERDITHAKEVDRMKTEFISLASHQLRTPLSAMKWFSEMLLAGDAGQLTDDQKEYIGNIDESNERMIALVNSLLNISRIESGRIIIDPQPTDIGKLIEDVLKELKPSLDAKKMQLVVSVHKDLPPIMVDPKLLFEVYKNLLTNAIKYTPMEGEVTIMVSKKGEELISQVSDTGYGIPKLEQERVFERFYRGTNIVKKETEGTGLGLYLVKAIIASSGGKIWFESEENKGTTFWFSLPMTGMKKKEGEISINA